MGDPPFLNRSERAAVADVRREQLHRHGGRGLHSDAGADGDRLRRGLLPQRADADLRGWVCHMGVRRRPDEAAPAGAGRLLLREGPQDLPDQWACSIGVRRRLRQPAPAALRQEVLPRDRRRGADAVRWACDAGVRLRSAEAGGAGDWRQQLLEAGPLRAAECVL